MIMIPAWVKGRKMRLITYAVSAACGCGTMAYPYVQSYYQPSTYSSCYYNYDPCGYSASTWGGDSVYGAMDPGPQYYVVRDTPYSYYAPRHVHVNLQLDAANHAHKRVVLAHHGANIKLASQHHHKTMFAKAKQAVHKTVAKAHNYIRQAVLIGPY